jgi:hypothetical protein
MQITCTLQRIKKPWQRTSGAAYILQYDTIRFQNTPKRHETYLMLSEKMTSFKPHLSLQ